MPSTLTRLLRAPSLSETISRSTFSREQSSAMLKCGKFHSSKTGEPTLCRTGYQRVVDVCTAVVPFYCATCRKANVRWKSDPSSEQDPADQPEDQSQPDTLTFTDRQQEQAEAASTYPVPQSHNALVLRDRDEKENEKADEDVTQDEEEIFSIRLEIPTSHYLVRYSMNYRSCILSWISNNQYKSCRGIDTFHYGNQSSSTIHPWIGSHHEISSL